MMKRLLLNIILILCLFHISVSAQESRDSLVRLISADKARLLQINGVSYRKVEGNALFLHNDTYLKCDQALWNVETNIIDAVGNVQIIQDKTLLTGDSLKYIVSEDLAQFRGHLVELTDKDKNTLRTKYLDYNTKDSIAHFFRGGAMKDKDGSIIESMDGNYYAKEDLFIFRNRVEMFSDSLFFKTDSLKYYSETDVVTYEGRTYGWYDVYGITSGGGWYNRSNETFYFDKKVHLISDENEGWCENLFYDRNIEYTRMEKNVEVVDTVNNSIVLCGQLEFWNEPRRSELYEDPVIILLQEQDSGAVDSVFIASDHFKYYQKKAFEVDSAIVEQANERYKSVQVDPLASKRPPPPREEPKADTTSTASADSIAIAQRDSVDAIQRDSVDVIQRDSVDAIQRDSVDATQRDSVDTIQRDSVMVAQRDSIISSQRDSLSLQDSLFAQDSLMSRDSLVAEVDSLQSEPLDTTLITFVESFHNVKIYKSDIQIKCDSLLYCSIDSIARLFTDPVIWYDGVNQITADSMQFVIRNENLEKGYMLSNAFVISEDESKKYYHQVKSPEMIGYFRESDLYRYDAIGGVSMIVFVAEDNEITTMNQKECRLMTSVLKDGTVEKMRYYEGIKSDVFPVYDLEEEKKYLKDFNWRIEENFGSRYDLTDKQLRKSLRNKSIPARNFPRFSNSKVYYPGYMDGIMKEIELRKPLIWLTK